MTTNDLFQVWMAAIDAALNIDSQFKTATTPAEVVALEERSENAHYNINRAYLAYKNEQAREAVEDAENEAWNPYEDACYAAQDEQDRRAEAEKAESHEFAQMQALAGWHHVPEIAPRESVRLLQAKAVIGAAVCMSLN